YGSEGLYPIFDDGVLYPVNAPSSASALISADKARLCAYVQTKDYVFIGYNKLTGSTNHIVRVDSSGAKTTLTLPASLTNSTPITSMVVWKDQLWVSTGT